jgi:hypothetical protein
MNGISNENHRSDFPVESADSQLVGAKLSRHEMLSASSAAIYTIDYA